MKNAQLGDPGTFQVDEEFRDYLYPEDPSTISPERRNILNDIYIYNNERDGNYYAWKLKNVMIS